MGHVPSIAARNNARQGPASPVTVDAPRPSRRRLNESSHCTFTYYDHSTVFVCTVLNREQIKMKASVVCVLLLAALAQTCVSAPIKTPFARLKKPIEQQTGYSLLGISEAEHNSEKVSDKEKMKRAMAVAKTHSKAKVGSEFGKCMNCVYVLERIKQGYQYLLPSICVEIFSKEGSGAGQEAYGMCHQVLASLSVWGNNVRHWFHYGCYKSEVYGAMELIRPCPSHVICAQMADFEKETFLREARTR